MPDPSSAQSIVDERTVAYILASRPAFEDLRQVLSQVAGLLVLEASGSKEGGPHHPMLRSACDLLKEAADIVRSSTPSARASHHHQHVLRAVTLLETACTAAVQKSSFDDRSLDAVLIPLRSAYEQLREAARCLPGFQLIAFERGCCAGSGRETQVVRDGRARPPGGI